jgi:hypothetical protein
MDILNCIESLFNMCCCNDYKYDKEEKEYNKFIILENDGTYQNIKCICNKDFDKDQFSNTKKISIF